MPWGGQVRMPVVCANGEKRRVAEIEQTRISHDDIEPQSQNHKYRRIGDGVEELQVEEQINYREKEQGGHAQTPGQPLAAVRLGPAQAHALVFLRRRLAEKAPGAKDEDKNEDAKHRGACPRRGEILITEGGEKSEGIAS